MSAKSLVITSKAEKQISKLPKRIQLKVLTTLTVLKQNPLSGIRLSGDLSGSYKKRLGDYRIVYDFHSKKSIVIILKVEHRQGVYK